MITALVAHKPAWLLARSDAPMIAVSSRVRLARNLAALPFPLRASAQQRTRVIEQVCAAARVIPVLADAYVLKLQELSALDRQFLVERHLASPEFAAQEGPAALLVTPDQTFALMVIEEDHLRLQALAPGFALADTWALLDQLDTALEQQVSYAFSPRYGYLTACPTNVGTGLRASVMVHVPALVQQRKIGAVISAVGKVGIAVRGLYGEQSEARGNLFQISNQITLGRTEHAIIQQLTQLIGRIIEHETRLREALEHNAPHQVRNAVGRAYGTLRYAEILKSDEATDLLSTLLMGIDLHVFSDVSRDCIAELLIDIQPAHLQKLYGRDLAPDQRDLMRATLVRERLHRDA
jgi:protein arginine kinase